MHLDRGRWLFKALSLKLGLLLFFITLFLFCVYRLSNCSIMSAMNFWFLRGYASLTVGTDLTCIPESDHLFSACLVRWRASCANDTLVKPLPGVEAAAESLCGNLLKHIYKDYIRSNAFLLNVIHLICFVCLSDHS